MSTAAGETASQVNKGQVNYSTEPTTSQVNKGQVNYPNERTTSR
jgi:hypothetical protein